MVIEARCYKVIVRCCRASVLPVKPHRELRGRKVFGLNIIDSELIARFFTSDTCGTPQRDINHESRINNAH